MAGKALRDKRKERPPRWLPFPVPAEQVRDISIAEPECCAWTCEDTSLLEIIDRATRPGLVRGVVEVAVLYQCLHCQRYTLLKFLTHENDPAVKRSRGEHG